MPELYFLADIDFCLCFSTMGVHPPVQYNSHDLEIRDSMEIKKASQSIERNETQEMKPKKARKIRLFQDSQKNSPPKRKACFVLKFVSLDIFIIP